jgi:hypothetical protein
LSYEDWLYRKMDQNAHNEILAFLVVILGINLLLGGLTLTSITVGGLSTTQFFAYESFSASTALGLILSATGFLVGLSGFILVIHYNRHRSWFAGEIDKSSIHRKKKINRRSVSEILEEYSDNRKED